MRHKPMICIELYVSSGVIPIVIPVGPDMSEDSNPSENGA